VHTDPNRCNILIGGARPVLVDWALPGRGASWLNLAFMVSSLISEGSSPGQAECWAGQFREWTDADPHAIDTFATALFRRRQEQTSTCPQPRRTERLRLAHFARTWLDHRRRVPDPPSPQRLKAPVAPLTGLDPDAFPARNKELEAGDRDARRTANLVPGC
jgi:hypothetical protein